MNKQEILEKVKELGLLAVIRGPSAGVDRSNGGSPGQRRRAGIEITYSTPNAEEVVKTLSEKFGDPIVLGMGTLTKTGPGRKRESCRGEFPGQPDLRTGTGESHGR